MYIGIASDGNDLASMVSDQFKNCRYLLIVTGMREPAVFDFIADSCITRYNGAGCPGNMALELMERRELKLIRNLEGTDDCYGSHHNH